MKIRVLTAAAAIAAAALGDVDGFTCPDCRAVPEQLASGKAKIGIVRHELGCPTLIAQTKTRWPLADPELPDTPRQVPFEQRAARNLSHRTAAGPARTRQSRRRGGA